jgi:hypothetical protein
LSRGLLAFSTLFSARTAQRTLTQLRWWLLAALALCCAGATHAQFVDASAAGEPIKLTAPWRYHSGDNPAWAAPGFDDSQWQLISPDKAALKASRTWPLPPVSVLPTSSQVLSSLSGIISPARAGHVLNIVVDAVQGS